MIEVISYGSERREHERKLLHGWALLFIPDHPPLKVKTYDISIDGISVFAPINPAPKTPCIIRIDIPGRAREANSWEVQARVIHSVFRSGEGFKIGMQFSNLADSISMAIAEYLHR